jgi:hypothetical protein
MATQNRAPTGDEASPTGTWSGSAGSRYSLVDDYPDTTPADYLQHGTAAGHLDFTFSAFSIPAGSTNISVQVLYYDAEPSNGNNNIAGRLVVGGTAYNAATHNPSGTSYSARSDNWATNPKTGAAWTVDDINGVGPNALQRFGWNSGDANPAIRLSSVELQVTYTPPQNSAYLSWAEMEATNAPRQLRASWGETEVPGAPRTLLEFWAEIETPNAARQARTPWAEFESPTAPRAARVGWGEVELPEGPRLAQLAWGELEAPDVGWAVYIFWAELEAPTGPRSLAESWAELETPNGPRAVELSWVETETPAAPRSGRVSFVQLDAPDAARLGELSWAEVETPDASRSLRASYSELETPEPPRGLHASWLEMQTPGVGSPVQSRTRSLLGVGI